jgi:hypothetical protein
MAQGIANGVQAYANATPSGPISGE